MFSVTVMAFASLLMSAQDTAAKASEIRKEIAALKQKIATLEGELVKVEKPSIKELNLESMQNGATVGNFAGDGETYYVKVVELLSPTKLLARVHFTEKVYFTIIVENYPTKGLVDDSVIDKGGKYWRVIETRQIDKKTLYVVEPFAAEPEKKK